ncbi:MAG: pyruvate kinase [Solirubrobacteraceae bacterium]
MEDLVTDSPAATAGMPPYEALEALRDAVVRDGGELFERWRPRIRRRSLEPSALNLAHYVALRRHELRDLQLELMPWGLSSLGRCESRVLESLDAVLATAASLVSPAGPARDRPSSEAFFRGHELLRLHTEAALGPAPAGRDGRIMVTLPTEAATDFALVQGLVGSGMDLARINCAHDDAGAWVDMAAHVRRAAEESGRPCRVCMDISGPRSRTGAVAVAADPPRLHVGDRVLMTATPAPPRTDVPAWFGCSLAEAVAQVQPGQSVWVNEGKLGAVVERKVDGGALLRVTHARPKGERLKADKGLNFPDTELRLDPLTDKDLRDLDVVAGHADMVGYSFVQRPGDIARLQRELAGRTGRLEQIALVAKIETQLAIRNLPELIVQGAGAQPMAVMIARGDLAVEVGPRRLGELQEEILWLCEAAHVPVIWATQVLDKFVHKGVPHRAEITDAAMGGRAECVMLNKGPYIADAVSLLDDVLAAMEGHQFKKASRMRALRSW